MERLSIGPSATYSAIEGSIHVGRYAPILPFCRGKRVLDVACGEGYGSWLLSQAGAESVLGLDVSAEAISQAKGNFQAENLAFDTCDAERVAERLHDLVFDVIVSIETIEHLQNPKAFLSQVKKLAAKDCVIMISCPNDHWYYTEEQSNPFHIRKYTFREFQDLAMRELGRNVRWFAGTAAQGFVAAPLHADGAVVCAYGRDAPSKYVAVERMGMSVLCPPAEADKLDTTTCSYFMGIWNAQEEHLVGGAVFPMSMNAYALREQAPDLQVQLMTSVQQNEATQVALAASEKAAQAALAASAQVVADLQALVDEGRAAQATAEQTVADLQRDILGFRVQTAALRRENDVLAQSVQHLRAETGRLQGEAQHQHDEAARLRGEAAQYYDEAVGLNAEAARLRDQVARHMQEEARLATEVLRLANENVVLQSVLATWTRRKQRMLRLIPRPLRVVARQVYRRLVPRQTLS